MQKSIEKKPVSDHTLFEQQNSTANKATAAGMIRHEIFGVPGFQHLNWLVPYHSDVPEVYFILMSMALGRVPQSEGWRSAASACEEETGLATNSIFFCFLFVKKIIDLPGGQINDPSSGKHYSLLFLPETPLSPSRTLERLFELTRRPSRALD